MLECSSTIRTSSLFHEGEYILTSFPTSLHLQYPSSPAKRNVVTAKPNDLIPAIPILISSPHPPYLRRQAFTLPPLSSRSHHFHPLPSKYDDGDGVASRKRGSLPARLGCRAARIKEDANFHCLQARAQRL